MLVSVIIPAFNVAGCIGRAIDSVLAQTHRNLEVIVVDDASTDETAAYVRQRATRDARIRLLQNTVNSGPSVARNVGLTAANGEWVAVLDADDACAPERLAALCTLGQAHAADVVCDNLQFYDAAAGTVIGVALPEFAADRVDIIDTHTFLANCITARSQFDYGQLKAVMRRDFLRRHRLCYPDDLRHGEDFVLYANMLLAGGRFLLVGRPYYLFTQRVGTASAQPSGFSRTVMNFGGMRAHTLALLAHPGVKNRPDIQVQLHRRATAILWHERRLQVSGLAQRRDFAGLFRVCACDWRAAAVLAGKVVRRVLPTLSVSSSTRTAL